MRLSTAAGRTITIFVIMLLTPWSSTFTNHAHNAQNTVLISTNDEPENLFYANATLLPPAIEWWQRGEELVSVYVITRDLASLADWQRANGFEKKQAPASSGQILVSLPQSSGEVEHRRLSLPAQVVPKLLGVSGVMSIFEDPGAPEAFASSPPESSSVRSGELHGAVDAWLDGVNGSGVKVAIVDSGIDFAHPDLNGTQARVDDANNSYDGWPIMWDPRSVDIWLKDGDAYPTNGGSWYSDTSNLDNDSNSDNLLDNTGFNISGINPSLSGTYHHGFHPDSKLVSKVGGEVDVLVVDDMTQGIYETVYVDIDRDGNFSDEIAMRRGNETAGLDTDADGLWDISAGLLYWISDGVNGVPYGAPYSSRAGFQNRIAGAGNLTLFMINDRNDPGGNHGTLCASAVAAQAVVNNGKVKGMAPNSELISVADFYGGGSFLDAWRFLAEGYDGQTGSGDEAQIGSFSFGWSNVHNDGTDQMSIYLDWLTRVHSPETSFLVAMGNGGHGYGTAVSPGGAHGIISVGAFSSQIGQSHGGTWGDSSS
ncbi:MAG: S8 family serine peptidase, partial [Candidatus Thalassarchaeaceae archaeon]|nr:S8 family serine peptidase [Candidatus Thalassarchaeaceae archaeon]